MLAPNKQNLIYLKSQLKTVKNGHKLLKEKRSGLILNFLEMARNGKRLESTIVSELDTILNHYQKSLTFISVKDLLALLSSQPAMSFSVTKKRLSGVYINNFEITVISPQRDNLKKDITIPLAAFAHIFPRILELTQIKTNVEKLAQEILKTNRQISNLESRIEQIIAETKYINRTIEEKNSLEKATLIKIFT